MFWKWINVVEYENLIIKSSCANIKVVNVMTEKSYIVIKGKEKIILSAPHSVMHQRGKEVRPRETRTGAIVKVLSKHCKTYGIYKSKNEYNDANWDKKCEYKKAVQDLIKREKIKALIDFHGMSAYRKQDICIGINGGKSIKNQFYIIEAMKEIFNKYGFINVGIDEPFAAGYKYCVSNYISRKQHILAFQIEINLKYRSSKYSDYAKYNELLKALEEIIKLVINEVSEK